MSQNNNVYDDKDISQININDNHKKENKLEAQEMTAHVTDNAINYFALRKSKSEFIISINEAKETNILHQEETKKEGQELRWNWKANRTKPLNCSFSLGEKRNKSNLTVGRTGSWIFARANPEAVPAVRKKKEAKKQEKIKVIEIGNEKECSICWEELSSETQFKLGCDHVFCVKCLIDLITIKISDITEEIPIKCVWSDCIYYLEDPEISALVGEYKLAKYQKKMNLQMLLKNPNLRYCPKPACSAILLDASPANPTVKCKNCHFVFCFHCSNEQHEGFTCEEYKNVLMSKENSDFTLMENWKQQNDSKPCPHCSILITKNSGCNHMTCVVCKYNFCWICLGRFFTFHFSEGNCKGRQFRSELIHYPSDSPEENVDIPFYFPSADNEDGNPGAPQSKRVSVFHRKKATTKEKLLILPFLFTRLRRKPQSVEKWVKFPRRLTVLPMGKSGSGKSALIERFHTNNFSGDWAYTIETESTQEIFVDGIPVIISCVDTSALEELEGVRDGLIASSNAFLFLFKDLLELEQAEQLIEKVARRRDKNIEDIDCLLVATHWDTLGSQSPALFDLPYLKRFSQKYNIPLIACSSLNNWNIIKIFGELVRISRRSHIKALSTNK